MRTPLALVPVCAGVALTGLQCSAPEQRLCLVSPTPPSASTGTETRCGEIDAEGGTCRCAESLDTDTFNVSSGGQAADPSNDGNAHKECAGDFSAPWAWEAAWLANPIPETDTPGSRFPSESDAYVWENTNGGSNLGAVTFLGANRNVLPDTRRLCYRHYFKLSNDYQGFSGPSGCGANKVADFKYNAGGSDRGSIQASEVGGYQWWCDGWSSCQDRDLNGGPDSLSVNDCRGEWCIHEMCISSPNPLTEAHDVSLSAYYEVVTGPSAGKREQLEKTFLGDAAYDGTSPFDRAMIIDMYRENECTGTRWFSHAASAEWNADGEQFIGPAYEIEGRL